MSLKDTLLQENRPQVVADCCKLIDAEVASKSGLGGMAIKGAFAVVKAVQQGMIPRTVDWLLDDMVSRLEPLYAEFGDADHATFEEFVTGRTGEVANLLLGVTDEKAHHSGNVGVRKAYEKLRPSAHRHVEKAVPGVAQIIDRYRG